VRLARFNGKQLNGSGIDVFDFEKLLHGKIKAVGDFERK